MISPRLFSFCLLTCSALFSGSMASIGAQTISTLISVTPCRIIDTRNPTGPFGGPGLAANSTRDIAVPNSACGIPSNAAAYSLNVTVVPHGSLSYLTLWPSGLVMPLASTLNSPSGAVVANAAIVPAGTNGSVSVFVAGATDVILDINGYFASEQLPTQQAIPSVVAQSTSGTTQNTALGTGASSVGGAQNTAVGVNALAANASGTFNTALGAGALATNSSGHDNTAIGTNALSNSPTGYFNSVLGSHGLESNTTGTGNTAVGYAALSGNTIGLNNTALGASSLIASTGSGNIAIGINSGQNLTSGSDNIDIANPGAAGESGVIRIGTQGLQNSIYIPAILGNPIGGSQIFVNGSGKLGTAVSSRRYKEDIQDIQDASKEIYKLRPVQFRYKQALDDGSKPLQYGLIAEEVESIYPQMIIRNKIGQVEGVQYQQLPPMMLNEMQKQQKVIARQEEDIHQLLLRVQALETQAAGQPAVERDRER